jgi:hypothetical protein
MQHILNIVAGICGLLSAFFWWRSAYLISSRQLARWLARNPTGIRPEGEKLADGEYRSVSAVANYHAAKANAFAAFFAGPTVLLSTTSSFLSQ